MPLVSAIITTWNRSAMLKRAIASVLAQTFRDFELIVLDNNSSDNTMEAVRAFRDGRLRYLRHSPLGISEARNAGVRESRGEFVGFLDDDDEWLPYKLEKQVTLFLNASARVGMVYGGFYRITPQGAIYDEFRPTLRGETLLEYLCSRDPLTGSASNALMRKNVFAVAGGYEERLKTYEDWEFYLRLMRKFEIDFVPEPLLNIRRHRGPRLGDRVRDAALAELFVVEEFKDLLKNHPCCLSRYLQAIGGKFCRTGEPQTGRKYLRQAITAYPRNWAAYAQYALSYAGGAVYRCSHALYKKFR